MSGSTDYQDYNFHDAEACHTVKYLLPCIFDLADNLGPGKRILDIGCGNGYIAGQFLRKGCNVVGVDLSETGIAIARKAYPEGRFEILEADNNVLDRLKEKPFDYVISTEVVEHLYAPRAYAEGCFAALATGGRLICSTPYHGYLKNLALSLAGKWDKHADPLWDGGHIKLWSRSRLSQLMSEAGFSNLQFRGAGRAPYLWKSMVISGDK